MLELYYMFFLFFIWVDLLVSVVCNQLLSSNMLMSFRSCISWFYIILLLCRSKNRISAEQACHCCMCVCVCVCVCYRRAEESTKWKRLAAGVPWHTPTNICYHMSWWMCTRLSFICIYCWWHTCSHMLLTCMLQYTHVQGAVTNAFLLHWSLVCPVFSSRPNPYHSVLPIWYWTPQ